jgi:hypothetical protein
LEFYDNKKVQNVNYNFLDDLKFSKDVDLEYDKAIKNNNALTDKEWIKYNNAMSTGVDKGLRISDNSILVECENDSEYQYKYVFYENIENENVLTDVYAIGKIDNNIDDDVNFQSKEIAKYIKDVKELGYDNPKYFKTILRTRIKDTSYILTRYNNKSKHYNVIGQGSVTNGTDTAIKSNGTRIPRTIEKNQKSIDVDDANANSLINQNEKLQESVEYFKNEKQAPFGTCFLAQSKGFCRRCVAPLD